MAERKKFDSNLQQQLIALLKIGMSIQESARILGVTDRQIRYVADTDPEFADQKKAAMLSGKAELISRIGNASTDQWQAAAWLLERRFCQEFGRRNADCYTPEQFLKFALALSDLAKRYVPVDKVEEYNESVEKLIMRLEGERTAKQKRKF